MPSIDDQEQILAYYAQVTQDIRDIKARPWNFITVLVVITGGILSFEVERIQGVRYWLFIGLFVAAAAALFISMQSWNKLKSSRDGFRKGLCGVTGPEENESETRG